MKRRFILLGLLASLSLTGCDFLDKIFDGDKPSEKQDKDEEKKEEVVTLESISVEGSLAKTTYYVGEAWSSEGLRVEAHYSNNTTSTIDADDYYLTFTPSSPSNEVNEVGVFATMLNLDLQSDEKFYTVTVTEKTIESIEIEGTFTKTTYVENNDWDPTGLSVRAYFDDDTNIVLANNQYTFEYLPAKALYGTTSVSVKAKLNGTLIESQTKVINGITVKHEFTISFNGNGSTSGSMAPVKTTELNYIAPTCSFLKTGFTFDKWALNSEEGTKYSVGESVPVTSNITLYATWTENSGGEDTYYASCEGLTGDALKNQLLKINKPVNDSYDWSRYEAADEAEDDSTCILSLYTRHNIKKNSHCGSYSWTTWNREHIWTQSAFPKSDADNHNIFACEGKINGERSNKIFAEGGNQVIISYSKSGPSYPTDCKQTSSTFEPCDAAKGEVARSVMYGTVMYQYTMTQEIDTIELALKWHLQHQITTRETKRNETVYGLQGNRNPFVDHPEYACKIWGNTNSQTRQLCGM